MKGTMSAIFRLEDVMVYAYFNSKETKQFQKPYRRFNQPVRRKQIFIVHRLDRETSGLIVFAKNETVKHLLQAHWHRARKKYYAVVEGIPEPRQGVLRSFLRENKFLNVYSSRRPDGAKLATT